MAGVVTLVVNVNNNINNNNNNINNVAVNTNNANNADANVNNQGANIVIAMPGRRRREVPLPFQVLVTPCKFRTGSKFQRLHPEPGCLSWCFRSLRAW